MQCIWYIDCCILGIIGGRERRCGRVLFVIDGDKFGRLFDRGLQSF